MNENRVFDPERSSAIKRMLMDTVATGATESRGVAKRVVLVVSLTVTALLLATGGAAYALGARPFFIFAPVPTPTHTDKRIQTPTPSPTDTDTPTATPSPSDILTIVLDADALSIEDASGAVIESYPYADGAANAISELTALLGTPVSTNYTPPGKCWSDMTTVTWNTLRLMYYGQDAATTKLFMLDVNRTPPTAVDITTPHGARVGASWADYFANVSGHLTKSATYQGQQLMSVVDTVGSNGPRSGTIVGAADGVITTIAAPSSLDADC